MQIKSWQIALIGSFPFILLGLWALFLSIEAVNKFGVDDSTEGAAFAKVVPLLLALITLVPGAIALIPAILLRSKYKKFGAKFGIAMGLIGMMYFLIQFLLIPKDIPMAVSKWVLLGVIPGFFVFFAGIYYFKVESKTQL